MKKPGTHSRFVKTAVASCAFSIITWLTGCDKMAPETPEAKVASNLVSSGDAEDSVKMPHIVDSATEFPAAMNSISTGSERPEYRDTGAGTTVVRVEKAPAISKPGQVMPQKELEHDWDGTVLIPDGTQMSHAHTDNVSFGRIEAHPLKNGSLRVWVRVNNKTSQELDTRVACNFQSITNEMLKTSFIPVKIPGNEAIDVYFMSPMPNVVSYTILVR